MEPPSFCTIEHFWFLLPALEAAYFFSEICFTLSMPQIVTVDIRSLLICQSFIMFKNQTRINNLNAVAIFVIKPAIRYFFLNYFPLFM